MKNTRIITAWERLDEETLAWNHNHIADGYDASQASPAPNSPLQRRSWRGATWRGIKMNLVDGKVID